jgi:hypothetical protein
MTGGASRLRAGVTAGAAGRSWPTWLLARDLRQQALRATPKRHGHEGLDMSVFIRLASFRTSLRRGCAEAERRSVRVEVAAVNTA